MKPDTGGTFSLSSGQMNEKFVGLVARQPHVKQAVGVLSVPVETITSINGTDIPQFEKISTGFRFIAGGLPKSPDDIIVDQYYAQQHKLKIGDTVKLQNHNWRVCGIIQGGMLGRLVVQLKTAAGTDRECGAAANLGNSCQAG
jgi:putative ABC transport system permease protein